MAEDKLFANVSKPVAAPAKAGIKQPEATTQEPANSAERVAEANKLKAAEGDTSGQESNKEEPAKESGVPALGSNSTAAQPAPLVPVPATIHEEPKQPTTVTGTATTNVVAADGTDTEEEEADEAFQAQPDLLTMLKKRADLMGIRYSNNIGVEALRAKINDTLIEKSTTPVEGQSDNVTGLDPETATVSALSTSSSPKKVKKLSLRQHIQQEKMKLVRLRITNLDPKKKDLQGEILTVANEFLGTVRKFIPYGDVTDNGFHVPYCLYEQLRDRQFLSIKTRKDQRTGLEIVEQQLVREFALEVLEPLSEAELAKLAAAQQMNGSIDNY